MARTRKNRSASILDPKERGRGSLERDILKTLAVAGGLIVLGAAVIVAPAALKALAPLLKKRRAFNDRSLLRAIEHLKQRRLVEFVKKDGKDALQITEEGKRRYRIFDFETMRLERSKWDRQWTIILFDIPEHKKVARDALRRKLRDLGCYQYHRSVFVHPVDCADEVDYIADFFGVSQYVIHFRTPILGSQEHRALRYFFSNH